MKSKLNQILAAAAIVVTGACSGTRAGAANSTAKADIPLDSVPQVVVDAAAKAVRGLSLTEAKLRTKKSGIVFKLEGVAGGKEYDLKVDSRGRVLGIEQDGDAGAAAAEVGVAVERPKRPNRADKASARLDEAWLKTYQPDPIAAASSPARQVGTLEHAAIRESSGIVASRKHPGVYWTHNDKGNAPVLYAVDATGKLLAEVPVSAPADDWEDVATDDAGNLYVGNIGNNKGKRPYLEVYRVAEPDPRQPSAGALKVDRTWRFPSPGEPLNCESLLVRGGFGYVISKVFTGETAEVYRFPLGGPTEVSLEKVVSIPVRTPVSAADVSGDGSRLAVLSPEGVHVFDIAGDVARAGAVRPTLIPVPLGKLEGLCFTPDGLLLTAEERQVYRMPL
jgi:hypothetical protein